MGYIPSLPPLLILESSRRGKAGEAYSSDLRLPRAAEEPGSLPWPAPRGPDGAWLDKGTGRGQSSDSGPSLQLEPATLISAAPTTEPPFCRCKEPWGPEATVYRCQVNKALFPPPCLLTEVNVGAYALFVAAGKTLVRTLEETRWGG